MPEAGDPRLDDLGFLTGLPAAPETYIAIGDYYLRHTDTRPDYADSALVYYDLVLENAPENLVALNRKGTVLRRLGREEEAAAVFERAIEADAFYIHTHVNFGNLLFSQDRLDQAVTEYRIATTIDSTDAQVWSNLALAYEKMGKQDPALLAYYKVAACDPTDPVPWERIAYIYHSRGLYSAARERFQEALARDPSRTDLKENIRILLDYADSTGTQ
jgi:tetratricopeptide (TPR) repeat protein